MVSIAHESQLTRLGVYLIERKLGSGAMGDIFAAVHEPLQKRVALKVLRPDAAEETRTRFLLEGIAASRVRHPNVVEVLDAGTIDGTAFMAMSLLEGETLADCLQRHGRLPLTTTIDLMLPLCAALDEAHRSGVVHRDVKPSNVFLHDVGRGQPEPILLDFGIAKLLGPIDGELTQNSELLGTPLYIAPEQADGQPGTAASDQYSLALTAYECLLGVRPHESERHSLVRLLRAVAAADIPAPRALDASFPEALESVLMRALQRAPEDRFGSLRAWGAALLPFASTPRRGLWEHAFVDAEQTLASANPPLSGADGSSPSAPSSLWAAPSLRGDQVSASEPLDTPRTGPPEFDAERSSISRRAPVEPLLFADLPSDRRSDRTAPYDPQVVHGSAMPRGPETSGRHRQLTWTGAAQRRGPWGARVAAGLLALSLMASVVFAVMLATKRGDTPEYEVTIEVSPLSAELSIDGEVVGRGQFIGSYPKDGTMHRLVARHPDYLTRELAFRDVPPPRRLSLKPRPGLRPAAESGAQRSRWDAEATELIAGPAVRIDTGDARPAGSSAGNQHQTGSSSASLAESSQPSAAQSAASSAGDLVLASGSEADHLGASGENTANAPSAAAPSVAPSTAPVATTGPSSTAPASTATSSTTPKSSPHTGNLDPWAD